MTSVLWGSKCSGAVVKMEVPYRVRPLRAEREGSKMGALLRNDSSFCHLAFASVSLSCKRSKR